GQLYLQNWLCNFKLQVNNVGIRNNTGQEIMLINGFGEGLNIGTRCYLAEGGKNFPFHGRYIPL
uniref:hypothetical protein n=1 Tax=Salmonella enterica TaxID=28901 RepID=UPI0026670423